MNRRTMFYKEAYRIDRKEFNEMIEEMERDAAEAGYEFEDYNTLFTDVTLDCILDYLTYITDEEFHTVFNCYSQNRLYIIMDGKKVDGYAALISGWQRRGSYPKINNRNINRMEKLKCQLKRTITASQWYSREKES